MGKRDSERAGLLFTTYYGHNPVNFTTQDVHSIIVLTGNNNTCVNK